MTARIPALRARGVPSWSALAVAGLILIAVGFWAAAGRVPAVSWFVSFVLLAGFVTGNLGLLMIGHVMSEEWLTPVRSEAEAAALTAPFLFVIAVPLLPSLTEIYPWATGDVHDLPRPRAEFLTAPFFLARGAFYLVAWSGLALWISRTAQPRRASAVGLALLVPTAIFAANDWALSRDPWWWSSLFGFAFVVSQLLAALAGSILISLLRPEHPSAVRMQSLERALLTLALLTLWIWFVHFLIVWLANIPAEAAWYLARAGRQLWLLLGAALPAMLAAVFILAPPGFGRRTMVVGSALLLLQHVTHLLWILNASMDLSGILVATGLLLVWAALFAGILPRRPTFAAERGEPSL
jgi:hypothetical protein